MNCLDNNDALEAKTMATGIILDLRKAFDYLEHKLILSKLEQLGVKGQAWFKSTGKKSHTIKCVERVIRVCELNITEEGKWYKKPKMNM